MKSPYKVEMEAKVEERKEGRGEGEERLGEGL